MLTGKVFKTRLTRRTRGISVEAIWRELGGRVGVPQRSPTAIADRILQLWKTQDVILIIHNINILPETEIRKLLDDFWLILLSKVGDLGNQSHHHKLLLFLLDYDDQVADSEMPFIERIDATWEPSFPVKFPNLAKFSESDLLTWIDYESDILPDGLKNISEETVKELLELSDNGIPEFALDQLCLKCGCNWYEESEKWLKRVS